MLSDSLASWAPFRIDALGIVTLLGAAETDRSVGRLCSSWVTEFLPFLAAYTVANNQITGPLPGFVLYNITDGIMATDLAGWFCRWLLCQDLKYSTTTITITSVKPRRRSFGWYISALLGLLLHSALIAMPFVIGDWWGTANSISIFMSVFVRYVVLEINRSALDDAAAKSESTPDEPDEPVKVFLTLPTGSAITISTTKGVVVDCLLTTPRPASKEVYTCMRALGWLSFGVHVIALGMCSLFCQLITVCVIVFSTILVVHQVGADEHFVGSRLQLEFRHSNDIDSRSTAYAELELTEKEIASMLQWNMFPHTSNTRWWKNYNKRLEGISKNRQQTRDTQPA